MDDDAMVESAAAPPGERNAPQWAPEIMPFLDRSAPEGQKKRYFKPDGSELDRSYYDPMGSAQGGRRVATQSNFGTSQYVDGQRDERVVKQWSIPYYPGQVDTMTRIDYFYDQNGRLVCAREMSEVHDGPLVQAESRGAMSTRYVHSAISHETPVRFTLYRYSEDGSTVSQTGVIGRGEPAIFGEKQGYDPKTSHPGLHLQKQADR